MANQEHLDILKQGVKAWNQWREDHPNVNPDLRDVDLLGINFQGANLENIDLRETNLSGANLSEAKLFRGDLSMAKFVGADLRSLPSTIRAFRVVRVREFTAVERCEPLPEPVF